MRKTLLFALAAAGLMASAPVGASDSIKGLADTCNNCHGVDGVSAGGSMPSLAGLPETYLRDTMLEWKAGTRFSATMGRLIKGYSEDEIVALAKYFAEKPWTPVAQANLDPKMINEGKWATDRCVECHGERGGEPDNDKTPRIDGQVARYIELELLKYRDPAINLPHEKMRRNTSRLTEEEVVGLAHFYASQQK
ncbi:MAG: c-type cytochrome [Thiotrichales bacterium]